MRTTRYFEEQALRKRPYIRRAWCEAALWVQVLDTADQKPRMLRVVTLDDGETVHNAFFDRDFA